jgi:predicted helicase
MVVMGNPPYSGESQNPHYTDNDVYKVEIGGSEKLKEKNSKWINDDYVKFIRFGESMIEKNGEGIIAMITAHGYIDNPTFRGMRWHLRNTFDKLYVLDLHGNTTKKEIAPDGTPDVNVFDIKTGVSIIFGVKKKLVTSSKKETANVYQFDMYGKRAKKFIELNTGSIDSIVWNQLPANCDIWKVEGNGKEEYKRGFLVTELFPVNSVGIATFRDELTVHFEKSELEKVVEDFELLQKNELIKKYGLYETRDWNIDVAIKSVKKGEGVVTKYCYRPFDARYTLLTKSSKSFIAYSRWETMKHLVKPNLALVLGRQGKAASNSSYDVVFVTDSPTDLNIYRRGGGQTLPIYIYDENGDRVANLNNSLLKKIVEVVGDVLPEDILDYIYAYLYSPAYRQKFDEFLKSDFPRVPYPDNKETFWKLVEQGRHLRELHLLSHSSIQNQITSFPEGGTDIVGKTSYKNNRVYINDTQYWDGVPKEVWDFYVGGYQPVQKYLKDRKDKKLTTAEFENYEKMIVSLNETIKIMQEIDKLMPV